MLVAVTDLGRMDAGAIVALELARRAVVGAAVLWLIRLVPTVILEREKMFEMYEFWQHSGEGRPMNGMKFDTTA